MAATRAIDRRTEAARYFGQAARSFAAMSLYSASGSFLLGAGVSRNFLQRYYVDVSYRYGRIFAKTATIEDDKGINTQRFQVGVGIRF